MKKTMKNEFLELTVDSLGAQMISLKSYSGTEYIWTGDPAYWVGHAPNLFPYVGRLTNKSYTINGIVYHMDIHGFAWISEMDIALHENAKLVFRLRDNESTLEQYPFHFEYQVIYELHGTELSITYTVLNNSNAIMPFGIGGHPGFCVPFDKESDFEDYFLEFKDCCQPERVSYSNDCFVENKTEVFDLEGGKILRLNHKLFDNDAIVLKNMSREITLKAEDSGKAVTVTYPQMNYLGIWHMPKTEAPYVCIEPWTSQASRKNIVEDLYSQSDLIHLRPGETYQNEWKITIKGDM